MNKLYNKIKMLLSTYKQSILTVENKNLTIGSKVSLFIFILIVFGIIGSGVEMQQSYIVKPHKQFSYKCTNFIDKNKEIDKFQNRNVSQDIYVTYYRYKFWILEDFSYNHQRRSEQDVLRTFGTNESCQELGILYLDIANSDEFKDRLIIKQGLKKKINALNQTISRKTDEYTNTLLEDIAKQDKEYSILSTSSKTVKSELKKSRKKLGILENELAKTEDISTLDEFKIFKKFLDDESSWILSQKREAIKYYRLKYTFNIFIFLFPVWLMFYVGYRVLKRKNYFVSSHLSLNVANVAALYIVFNFFLLIYTIIPKVFFNKLIQFLSQYNLTLLLNIAAILFFMILFGFFINRIQRNRYKDNNLGSKEALRDSRRKNLNSCIKCGNRYDEKDKFCGFCSHKLKTECSECKEMVESDYTYCTNCNKKL